MYFTSGFAAGFFIVDTFVKIWYNYLDNKYFYVRDFMQNILGIVNSSGNIVVKYYNTAYGRGTSITGSLASTIGKYNHMRYKGYYFDEETSFFYCMSRYYVPEWCRFLNADHISFADQSSPVGMNLFAYCRNNPVMFVDSSGCWPKWLSGIIETISALAGSVADAISNNISIKKSIGHEQTLSTDYYFFTTVERGIGYNKDFGGNTPVTLYLSAGERWWEFWEWSVGIDVNVNGYGASISIGLESAIGVHVGNVSHEVSANALGRITHKVAHKIDGVYEYSKYSLNMPESVGAAVALYYGGAYVMPFIISFLTNLAQGGAPSSSF